LLSGPIIGGVIGKELQEALAAGEGERRRGHLFVAMDPGAFGDRSASAERTSRYAAELKTSRKAAGVSEIVMPGERGRQKKARYAKDGIPLDAAIWQNTLRIAGELGVAAPQL
jgi:LDH2 family malate/lactate/ureidoglycolate dehydrogenase